MSSTMIPQSKHDYAMSLSHMTELELLKYSDELHSALEQKENYTAEQQAGLKEGIQAIFEAILRREALSVMSMDELNHCIVEHEAEQQNADDSTEQEHIWNAQVWEADARAEFMRRMTQLVHAAFTEEEESIEEDESEPSE